MEQTAEYHEQMENRMHISVLFANAVEDCADSIRYSTCE